MDLFTYALARKGGGGGSSNQSDWNNFDTNSAAYIQNKPFYSEIKKGRKITFTTDSIFEGVYGIMPYIGLVDGESYTAVVNGIEFTGVAEKGGIEDLPEAIIFTTDSQDGPQVIDGCSISSSGDINLDSSKAIFVINSEELPVGTEFAIYGKNVVVPSSPQTVTTTDTLKTPVTYSNLLGLIEGNNYILDVPARMLASTVTADMISAGYEGKAISISSYNTFSSNYKYTVNFTLSDGTTVKNEARTPVDAKEVGLTTFSTLCIDGRDAEVPYYLIPKCTITKDSSTGAVTFTQKTGSIVCYYSNMVEGIIIEVERIVETAIAAENLRNNSTFKNYFDEDVIGLVIDSSSSAKLIIDGYKLPSSASSFDDFKNGTLDSNVCSIYYANNGVQYTIPIAGEFAPPSFDFLKKIDEKYLPQASSMTCERILVPAGLSFTGESGVSIPIISHEFNTDENKVQLDFTIKTHKRALDSSGNYIIGAPLLDPEIHLVSDANDNIQCLDEILRISIYNYYASYGDIELVDLVESYLVQLGATGISKVMACDLAAYGTITYIIIGSFTTADIAASVKTALESELSPILSGKDTAIYRIPNYDNITATIASAT